MEEVAPCIEAFLDKLFDHVQPIDVQTVLKISDDQVSLARPLFTEDQSTMNAIPFPENNMVMVKSSFLGSPILDSFSSIAEEENNLTEPKFIGFIYPMDNETIKPDTLAVIQTNGHCEISENTHEFEDSFPNINLTQLLAIPEGNQNSNSDQWHVSPTDTEGLSVTHSSVAPDEKNSEHNSRQYSKGMNPVFVTAGGKKIHPPSTMAIDKARHLIFDDAFSSSSDVNLLDKEIILHDCVDLIAVTSELKSVPSTDDNSKKTNSTVVGTNSLHFSVRSSSGMLPGLDEVHNTLSTEEPAQLLNIPSDATHSHETSFDKTELSSVLCYTKPSTTSNRIVRAFTGQLTLMSEVAPQKTKSLFASVESAGDGESITSGPSVVSGSATGFVSASGRQLAPISDAALQKARSLFASVESAGDGESITSGPSVVSGSVTGFVSSSGRQLAPISEIALQKAKNWIVISKNAAVDKPNQSDALNSQVASIYALPTFNKEATEHANLAPINGCDLSQAPQQSEGLVYDESSTQNVSHSGKKASCDSSVWDGDLDTGLLLTDALEQNNNLSDIGSDGDSLVCIMEKSQFRETVQAIMYNHGLHPSDSNLEALRIQGRFEQQEVISQKLKAAVAKKGNSSALHETGSLHCPGLLWRLRLSKRRLTNANTSPTNHRSYESWSSLLHTLVRSSKCGLVKRKFSLPGTAHLPADFSTFSIRTAARVRWLLDENNHKVLDFPMCYEIGDRVKVFPDGFGCAGKKELISAFLASPGVSLRLVSRDWLEHHYDLIVWKLGCTALRFSPLEQGPLPADYFSPHHVLLRLRYRYDRELDAAERPALRRIVELDDTPARRLVLCVSELDTSDTKLIKARLTDGWYQLVWQLDPSLARLIRSRRIRVGSKLVTAGAELVSVDSVTGASENARTVCTRPGGSGDYDHGHLFESDGAAVGVALKLHGNSTRPVPWYMKLGFAIAQPKSGIGLYPVALSSLEADGGLCAAIRVVIQRRYTLQYMETLETVDDQTIDASDGPRSAPKSSWKRHVFRSERAEQAEAAQHDILKRNAFDRVLNNLVPRRTGQRRKQPTHSELSALGNDGEALFSAVMGALDPPEAEADLSDSQRDAIRQFKETALRNAVAEATPTRKVTPLLRVRLAGLHPKDIETNCVVPMTFWNPTDELLSLIKEGEPMEIYRVQASTTRTSDPFVPPNPPRHVGCMEPGTVLSLSGGRNTTIRLLSSTIKETKKVDPLDSVDENLISQVYEPRCALSVTDVQRLSASSAQSYRTPRVDQGFLEVDLCCTVVTVHSSSSNLERTASSGRGPTDTPSATTKTQNCVLDSIYVTDVDSEVDGCLAVVKLWGGLQAQNLTCLVRRGQRVHFTDLQLRHRQIQSSTVATDKETGLRSTPVLTLHYTVASNVTADKSAKTTTRCAGLSVFERLNSHLDRLTRLAECHWSLGSGSLRTTTSMSVPRFSASINTPVKMGFSSLVHSLTPQDVTPIARLRERMPLRTPAHPPQSLKQCLEWNTPVLPSTTPIIPNISTPEQTVSATAACEVKKNTPEPKAEPLLNRGLRSTPRTGLSRRGRPRNKNPTTATAHPKDRTTAQTHSLMQLPPLSVTTPVSAGPSELPSSNLQNPTPLIFGEDQLSETPKPKRRRISPVLTCKEHQTDTDEKENHSEPFEINSPPQFILEDTQELISSPVYSSSRHPASPLRASNPAVCSVSLDLSSMEVSTEDLDVSIADLVKTRRRTSSRPFPTSSTPTRTKSRYFSAQE